MDHPDETTARLVRELYSGSASRRRGDEVVKALVALGPRAVPELIGALKSPPVQGWWFLASVLGATRKANEAVVKVLASIGDPRVVAPLGDLLRTAGISQAPDLIRALGELNHSSAVPILSHVVSRFYEDEDRWRPIRVLAARTLVQIPGHSDFRALLHALPYLPLSDADLPDGWYQGPSQEGLVNRIVEQRDPAALTPMLWRGLGSGVSARQVARFGLVALPQLLRALDPGALPRWEPLDSDKALEALVLLGPEAVPAIRSHLRGASRAAASRCSIALCLMGHPAKELVEPVLRALEQDWSAELALAACAQLLATRDPSLRRALPILRRRLWTAPLTAEARASCQGMIRSIETETTDLKNVPLPASAPDGPAHDLPIASRPGD